MTVWYTEIDPFASDWRALAVGAAVRWRDAYYIDGTWQEYPGATLAGRVLRPKEETWARLTALGAAPDPDAVDAVIGNGSWTRTTCDSCGDDGCGAVAVADGLCRSHRMDAPEPGQDLALHLAVSRGYSMIATCAEVSDG